MAGKEDVSMPEEQFLLRLTADLQARVSDELACTGTSSMEISIDGDGGTISFQGKSYRARFVPLSTIVETHKTLDKKQFYKIADVSRVLVMEEMLYRHAETSGITPPMKYCRLRRFRPRKRRIEYIEEIEQQIARHLEEDMRAESIEYYFEDEISPEELNNLAIELESDLQRKQPARPTTREDELRMQISEIDQKMCELEEYREKTKGFLMQKRLRERLAEYEEKKRELVEELWRLAQPEE